MNKELYITIKTFLAEYQFTNTTTLHDLHKTYKTHMPFVPFREFVGYVKQLGVGSKSVRTQRGVERHYFYEPRNDKYLLRLFPVMDTCPTCEGRGVIRIDVKKST